MKLEQARRVAVTLANITGGITSVVRDKEPGTWKAVKGQARNARCIVGPDKYK